MNMTKEEFARNAGFILGTAGTFVLLQTFGLTYWPTLIGAVCAGIGMGWVFQTQFKQLEMRSKE